jgi:DNA-binding CsgD family transcriptional regulator/tetratricopeptide (TPR) repeat protein
MGSGAFVGRTRELEQLERALEAAAAGAGATVLVAGEAGIGKTRLGSELATRARAAGFEVLVGRCLDLVGTELPFQPFVDALRPLGEPRAAGSQSRRFEETLALLSERAAATPVLLVLEDLHWADASTLDLVVYLVHNLDQRRVVLLATYRADEPSSAERVRRLVDGVRRSGSVLAVELGPLESEELTALLAARADTPPSPALTKAIVVRSEGNPFFAEELLAAAGDQGVELPRGLRDLLLQRVARLDRRTQGVLRLAAAAGRDVGYPLLRAAAELPERDVRESLRRAVEQGVLVADHATGGFRFRHALLAEAIYATLLPGEREQVHARLAEELARGDAPASPAELAPHWDAAGRAAEALTASVEAAREAEAVWGLAEALGHLERALALWPGVSDAEALTGLDLAELCAWTARLAGQTGAAPRAVELARRAIELVGDGDPLRSALLHERLGSYLWWSGDQDAGLAERERAVELVPPEPPSAERALVLAALGNGLMTAWRHEESRAVCEQALALARTVGASEAELRALAVLGIDLAYLGRAEEGLAALELALRLAEETRAPHQLYLAYALLTDALTMLGRPRESARLAATGIDALRPYGHDDGAVVANRIEALGAIGDWDSADALSAAAGRASAAFFAPERHIQRAYVEIGRGRFESAREHLEAAGPKLTTAVSHKDELYDQLEAELALWERRWPDADRIVRDGLARARSREAALVRVQLCAQGLRAQAELAALARARRDDSDLRVRLAEARELLAASRQAAAQAADVTPYASAWRAQAEAEHERAEGHARPDAWAEAAAVWDRLDRAPLAAYCRWRQAEALVAAGVARADATVPLREAYAVASRIGARPLLRELELLAERARLELAEPEAAPPRARQELEAMLGLTPREAEVLTLIARGLTNREIAKALVISTKTASVHVSHILRKLDAPNRVEAAAIAHRVALPGE